MNQRDVESMLPTLAEFDITLMAHSPSDGRDGAFGSLTPEVAHVDAAQQIQRAHSCGFPTGQPAGRPARCPQLPERARRNIVPVASVRNSRSSAHTLTGSPAGHLSCLLRVAW